MHTSHDLLSAHPVRNFGDILSPRLDRTVHGGSHTVVEVYCGEDAGQHVVKGHYGEESGETDRIIREEMRIGNGVESTG